MAKRTKLTSEEAGKELFDALRATGRDPRRIGAVGPWVKRGGYRAILGKGVTVQIGDVGLHVVGWHMDDAPRDDGEPPRHDDTRSGIKR